MIRVCSIRKSAHLPNVYIKMLNKQETKTEQGCIFQGNKHGTISLYLHNRGFRQWFCILPHNDQVASKPGQL